MNYKKDQSGLYYRGELKSTSYEGSLKELYQLSELPSGFCVNEDHEAEGYSVVDTVGVQHIYELSPKGFYNALMKMADD